MNEPSIIKYITDTFDSVELDEASGDSFFCYDPDGNEPLNHRFPFVTIVTSDNDGSYSNLSRPSVFRLNIGISKQTFRSLFGPQTSASDVGDVGDTGDSGYDFTALDQVMPHPVYGRMYWVCVLNPSDTTFQEMVRPLLAEAYDLAASKYTKRAARG